MTTKISNHLQFLYLSVADDNKKCENGHWSRLYSDKN